MMSSSHRQLGIVPALKNATILAAARARVGLLPILYLWPWLAGMGIFAAILDSPQGIALTEEYASGRYSSSAIVATIGLVWFLVAFSCLLALVAASKRHAEYFGSKAGKRLNLSVVVLINGIWVECLSLGYAVLFWQSAASHVTAVTTIVLGLFSIAATVGFVVRVHRKSQRAREWLGILQRYRLWLAVVSLLAALVPLAVGAVIAIERPTLLASLGPLLIAMIGLAATSTLFGVTAIVIPICLGRIWLGAALMATMALWFGASSREVEVDNPLLREAVAHARESNRRDKTCRLASLSLEQALDVHSRDASPDARAGTSDMKVDRTLYLVSAEGGGTRAAYWTALNLAQVDIATGGRFGDDVAVLSGVSGGSLGVAAWLAARDRVDLSSTERRELLVTFLRKDFLSPLVAGFLFLDVPRVLLGPSWFSARREHVFEKALVDFWQETGGTDFFARPFLGLCVRGVSHAPAVYFNATDAITGAHVALSASIFPSTHARYDLPEVELRRTSLAEASVAQAVHISARFPYLSPAAIVGVNAATYAQDNAYRELSEREEQGGMTEDELAAFEKEADAAEARIHSEGLWRRVWTLVDGGYLDNSALIPTKRALSLISEKRERETKATSSKRPKRYSKALIRLIHLSNEPGQLCLEASTDWLGGLSTRARRFLEVTGGDIRCAGELAALESSLNTTPLNWLTAPIQSILSVRTEHSRRALFELRDFVYREHDSYKWLQFMEFSLSKELAEAYGKKDESLPQSIFSELSFLDSEMMMELVPDMEQQIRREVQGGFITEEAAVHQLKALSGWYAQVTGLREQAECYRSFSPTEPPLGWTLSQANRRILECLAFRSAARNAMSSPPLPVFQAIAPSGPEASRP